MTELLGLNFKWLSSSTNFRVWNDRHAVKSMRDVYKWGRWRSLKWRKVQTKFDKNSLFSSKFIRGQTKSGTYPYLWSWWLSWNHKLIIIM